MPVAAATDIALSDLSSGFPEAYRAAFGRTRWTYSNLANSEHNRLTLLQDGTIGGYVHPNEVTWEVKGGRLRFMNGQSELTVEFNQISVIDDLMVLTGTYTKDPAVTLRLRQE